jgi:hypothetical protein
MAETTTTTTADAERELAYRRSRRAGTAAAASFLTDLAAEAERRGPQFCDQDIAALIAGAIKGMAGRLNRAAPFSVSSPDTWETMVEAELRRLMDMANGT